MVLNIGIPQSAYAYKKIDHVPDFLGLEKGTVLDMDSLVTGKMTFLKLDKENVSLKMDMSLSGPAIKALELVTGKKIVLNKNNKAVLIFDVFRKKDGEFKYKLSNKTTSDNLLEGDLDNYDGDKTATSHDTRFVTQWVTFNINTNKKGKDIKGKATFAVFKVPLPLAIEFKKIK